MKAGNARRGGRGRSSVRGARRRRHDGPTDGVLGIGRRRVRARRARARAGSRDLRLPRRARRLRDGGRPSAGGLGARVARPAHRPAAPTSSRSKRTTSTPAPAGSWRSPGSAERAHRGGRRAPGLTFAGLTPVHTAAHLARALVEGVAFDAARCLDRAAPDAVELSLAGGGASMPLWRRVLSGVANRPSSRGRTARRPPRAPRSSPGERIGSQLDADRLDPVSIARAAVRFRRRRLRRSSDAARDGGARHGQRLRSAASPARPQLTG